MNIIRKIFTPGKIDSRINVSILSPKSTILNSILIMLYSGIILEIYDNIEFSPENSYILVGSILTLIFISSVCIAALTSYLHYANYTKPLLYLANAAKEVSSGNYTIQLPPHRNDGKIDEIDALYQDFNTMVEELNSTEILKSSFISNISHELKTPIAVISNYSTLLSKENLSEEEKKEYISKIKLTSSDLTNLITNILQISKLDNHQITVNNECFDLSEEIVQCILGFELRLDEKDIDLQLDIPDSLSIESDPGLLKIAINNILSNAIKFSEDKGQITITVNDDSDNVSIAVKDNGCGMTEYNIKHIFDKFYQADTSHATKGNGLGLAMVKQIINLLNGTINVNSKLNEGSEFIITLPKKTS
ncbi:MAG: HAMP domain-containing histidine kinase [Butyrivibrio sp.]|nr:HAMP domain-containing histidine kinase [Butyrivibrio sp.]